MVSQSSVCCKKTQYVIGYDITWAPSLLAFIFIYILVNLENEGSLLSTSSCFHCADSCQFTCPTSCCLSPPQLHLDLQCCHFSSLIIIYAKYKQAVNLNLSFTNIPLEARVMTSSSMFVFSIGSSLLAHNHYLQNAHFCLSCCRLPFLIPVDILTLPPGIKMAQANLSRKS